MYNRTRGLQGADWFEVFTRDDLVEAVHGYGKNSHVRELLDFGRIERMIADWPEEGSRDRAKLMIYRNQLLPALAVADFIDFHFPD